MARMLLVPSLSLLAVLALAYTGQPADARSLAGAPSTPKTPANCSNYQLDESQNKRGANRCYNYYDCAGCRTCSAAGWCQGAVHSSPPPPPASLVIRSPPPPLPPPPILAELSSSKRWRLPIGPTTLGVVAAVGAVAIGTLLAFAIYRRWRSSRIASYSASPALPPLDARSAAAVAPAATPYPVEEGTPYAATPPWPPEHDAYATADMPPSPLARAMGVEPKRPLGSSQECQLQLASCSGQGAGQQGACGSSQRQQHTQQHMQRRDASVSREAGTRHVKDTAEALPQQATARPTGAAGPVMADAAASSGADGTGAEPGPSGQAPPAPPAFLCPITQEVMRDPVVAADGFSYERGAIQEWLARSGGRGGLPRSPMTNLPLEHAHLVPNMLLRNEIRQWADARAA